ncbi:MAG: response regulator [bacterium]|nr:response regulator [bacterium]
MDSATDSCLYGVIPLEEILAKKSRYYGLRSRSFLYPAENEQLVKTFRSPDVLAESGIAPQFYSNTVELAISNPDALDINAFQESGIEVVLADSSTVARFWDETKQSTGERDSFRRLDTEEALVSMLKALESIAIREFYFFEENYWAERRPLVFRFYLSGETRQYLLAPELTTKMRLLFDSGRLPSWLTAVFCDLFVIEQSEIVCRNWHCFRLGLLRNDKFANESECASGINRTGRILLVDDDRRFASLLERVLGDAGHEVTISYSAAEALHLLEQAGPDRPFEVVLSDMHMPMTNGEEFFLELRRRHVDIPVIVLTSDDSPELEASMVKKGVSAFIDKSRDPEVVLAWCTNIIAATTRMQD